MSATYDELGWTYDMAGATYDGDGGAGGGKPPRPGAGHFAAARAGTGVFIGRRPSAAGSFRPA